MPRQKPLFTVPFSQVERTLSVIRDKTGDTNNQISAACGYDDRTITQWKLKGKVPLRGSLAIVGLAFELELRDELLKAPPPPPVVAPMFDHDELMAIFTKFLVGVSIVGIDDDLRKRIVGKLASALTI